MEPEIYTKMLRTISEELKVATPFYNCLYLEASPLEGQSLQPKEMKRRKRKGGKVESRDAPKTIKCQRLLFAEVTRVM